MPHKNLLTLRLSPQPEPRSGGGKSRTSIKVDRLTPQTQALASDVVILTEQLGTQPKFASKLLLVIKMFDDSYAPSHTPDDLFSPDAGYRLVAPLGDGYLIEASADAVNALRQRIRAQPTVKIQADISRVKSISFFNGSYALQGLSVDALWETAVARDRGRIFFLWPTPLKDSLARTALVSLLKELSAANLFIPAPLPELLPSHAVGVVEAQDTRLVNMEREYQRLGTSLLPIEVENKEKLNRIIASGAVVRIDPARRIDVAEVPGDGTEPTPNLVFNGEPVVAVIDGGRTAVSYAAAEAWRSAPPFVSDAHADTKHGNAVTSLIVNGHEWNNNRPLPAIKCRVGIVQAVGKRNAPLPWDELSLLDYLDAVARRYPDAKVWNIAANQPSLGTNRVSVLGHRISQIARTHNILPIISIGNAIGDDYRLQPPADCEAALVVGGRKAKSDGTPGEACDRCAAGPGPELMLKPEVSWFSELRTIGGDVLRGSSYSCAITSPLAAHTYAQLREPHPDLVKALLIHATEGQAQDDKLGWGTPYRGVMPWQCSPGTIALAFRAELRPGWAYYWSIPILPQLVSDNKLKGTFKLTAILKPLTSPNGTGNYFGSRLQTNLQCRSMNGKPKAILGMLQEEEAPEQQARTDLKKWQPVRHFPAREIKKGWSFSGNALRLYAQVYLRDRFQLNWASNAEAPPQEVSFVLSMASPDNDDGFYDAAYSRLGSMVETAITQEVETNIETNIPPHEG